VSEGLRNGQRPQFEEWTDVVVVDYGFAGGVAPLPRLIYPRMM